MPILVILESIWVILFNLYSIHFFLKFDLCFHLDGNSRSGLRQYAKPADIKRVKSSLGISIISTSKGVMTDK